MRSTIRSYAVVPLATSLVFGATAATSVASAATPTHATTASTSITRAHVITRAGAWLNKKSIKYSEYKRYRGYGKATYRGDCSGFVSMALALPSAGGGPSTVTLTKYVTKIKKSSLKKGDLVGYLGPNSGGQNGHVQIFLKWANSKHTKVQVEEQGGLANVPNYPHTHVYSWPEKLHSGATLSPYRYKKIK